MKLQSLLTDNTLLLCSKTVDRKLRSN